jgi:crossover junction endodeoxyribonuclease RusA
VDAETVIVEVRGLPAAQGSKRHVGGGRMIEMSRAVGPWREAVRAETQRAMNGAGPLPGALRLRVVFTLPRPKSIPKAVRHPAKRPDLDKLLRALLDGLTEGGAWHDDGQVVHIMARKDYTTGAPGCWAEISPMEDL